MAKPHIITGEGLMEKICEALDIDHSEVVQVVVDARYHTVAQVYIVRYGDERLLSVQWTSQNGIEIVDG